MRLHILYILLFLNVLNSNAQYYLRGEVRDEKEQPLQNARILLQSNHQLYYTDVAGSFGISANLHYDSLLISLEGYEPLAVKVNTDQWQHFNLKVLPSNVNRNRPRLICVTKDLDQAKRYHWYINDETYFQLVENDFVNANEFPNTGFSLNINKASYSNIRRFLRNNSTVPPDAVRTEELLNYFNLHYREPENGDVFKIESQLTTCPWDKEKQLLILNVNAKKLDLSKVPPGNFVFLIDASGSMELPNRLPLLKAAFQLLVKNLRATDTVSIVTYGGTVGVWMQPTSGANKEKILKSIEEINADGDTPGEAAIIAAYQLAKSSFIKGGNNRVILATDGDFNVGLNSEKALDELITKERQTGVYLTCLGVGMGNYKDSKLETLAKRGNGNYAYLDDIQEAEKVLVKELTQTFYEVAEDVFMNVKFNPGLVKAYRLIGFDNRRDAANDSKIDLEGGEVGSGNSVMAIFEIVPASEQVLTGETAEEIAKLSMRYSLANDTAHQELTHMCKANLKTFDNLDKDIRFAVAVSMFGSKLKQSKYLKDTDWEDIQTIASNCYDPASYLQTEFLQLIEKAKKVYSYKKKKKKDDN